MYYDIFFHIWPSSFERLLLLPADAAAAENEENYKNFDEKMTKIFSGSHVLSAPVVHDINQL